jgi:hypothetical protein
MIARHRGEHDSQPARWRPGTGRQPAHAIQASDAFATDDPSSRVPRRTGAEPRGALRRFTLFLVIAAAAGIAMAHLAQVHSTPSHPVLPETPRAWLDAYEAAAIDNPDRVCSTLFAPALARAYAQAIHSSCRSYFRHITSISIIVHRILGGQETAVLELQQTVRPRSWAVVLSRRLDGWQAVDLVPGVPLR